MNFDNITTRISAQKSSFWQLIKEKKIRIPNYQREYAQGRLNRRAEIIRNGFVSSLYDALKSKENLELDFIFGGNENDNTNDIFNPVDGQQRLTILFLLHWYIFTRAKKMEELEILKEHFLYTTRTTSENFCEKICNSNLSLDFSKESCNNVENNVGGYITSQIINQPWFTGAMESDPTVASMLVVIDCIHNHFKNDNSDAYGFLSELLTSKECPITFYSLDLNDVLGITSGIRDLYIKMNARGVPLTDFELFKAALQKKENGDGKIDLMAGYLKDNDTAMERIRIIGKFNNEYTNFFFKLIDEGKIINNLECNIESKQKNQLFDMAMMNFINEVFRLNYFCAISELGVGQKTYRGDNDFFRKMSGKEFSTFIETCGKQLNEKYWHENEGEDNVPQSVNEKIKATIISSFSNIIDLLDCFSSELYQFDTDGTKCSFSLKELIKLLAVDPQNNRALPFRESVVRMVLYDFILKFDFNISITDEKKEAFVIWNRFVWKMDTNTEFKNFDEAIETLRGYRAILSRCTDCNAKSIINAIASVEVTEDNGVVLEGKKVVGAPAEIQLYEEIIKAKLISKDPTWKEEFYNAEEYFSNDGQVWFLLDLSKSGDSYSHSLFKQAFCIAKQIFNEKKYVEGVGIEASSFERALLALNGFDNKDHLLYMGKYTTNTKRFVGRDFSYHISHRYAWSNEQKENDRYAITVALLKEMVNEPGGSAVSEWINNYISANDSKIDWKSVFINYNLLGASVPNFTFKNGFEPGAWKEDGYSYTAVYTNEQKRTDSGELHSFALAKKLYDINIQVKYTKNSSEQYIVNGFPCRYFTIGQIDVGYMKGEFYYRKNGSIISIGDFDSAEKYLTEMFSDGDLGDIIDNEADKYKDVYE